MKQKNIIKKTFLIAGVIFSLLLMISSATAVQVVNVNILSKNKVADKHVTDDSKIKNIEKTELLESLKSIFNSEGTIKSKIGQIKNRMDSFFDENDLDEFKEAFSKILEKDVEPCSMIGGAIGLLTWPLAFLFFGFLELVALTVFVVEEITGFVLSFILAPWFPGIYSIWISFSSYMLGIIWLLYYAMAYWPWVLGSII